MQQNNLMKAREEKYKSRIRVLEALASGKIHVSSNATNGKAHVSFGDDDLNVSANGWLLSLFSFLNCFPGCCRACAPDEGLFLI